MPKKTTSPAVKLTPLKVQSVDKPAKKGEVPTLKVCGDYPFQYNEASAIAKKAGSLMKELKPNMLPAALKEIYEHNSDKSWEAVSSANLQDKDGNVTRVTFSAKYSEVTAEVAEQTFSRLKTREGEPADVNNYFCFTMQGEFDSSAFLNTEGRFDKKKYEAIMKAMEGVSRTLGIPNPLSTKRTVAPLPSFHARRWVDFDAKANETITENIPNQINFVPCPNVLTGKLVGEDEEGEENGTKK